MTPAVLPQAGDVWASEEERRQVWRCVNDDVDFKYRYIVLWRRRSGEWGESTADAWESWARTARLVERDGKEVTP